MDMSILAWAIPPTRSSRLVCQCLKEALGLWLQHPAMLLSSWLSPSAATLAITSCQHPGCTEEQYVAYPRLKMLTRDICGFLRPTALPSVANR